MDRFKKVRIPTLAASMVHGDTFNDTCEGVYPENARKLD